MAIEIKELIIRAVVNNTPTRVATENTPILSPIDRKEIIKDCVEKVLEKLELKSLR